VFGYQPRDPLFKVGAGNSPTDPVHGAVVFGSADSVKRLLAEPGSTSTIRTVIPLVMTAIICKGPSGERIGP
jgi:hypothetical protein